MAKFTKLNIWDDVVASRDGRVLKKLSVTLPELEKLPAPVDLQLSGDILTFMDMTSMVQEFEIYVDGQLWAITDTSSYDLSKIGLPDGTYSVTVIAKAVEGYADSEPSEAISYTVSAVKPHPVVVSISSGSSQAMTGVPNVFNTNIEMGTAASLLTTIDSTSDFSVGTESSSCNVYLNDELVYSNSTGGMYKVDMSEATHVMVLADSVRSGGQYIYGCNIYVYTHNIEVSEEVNIEITKVTGSNSVIKYNDTTYRTVGSFVAKTGDVIICNPAGSNPYTAINGKSVYGLTSYWIVTAPATVTLYYYQAMYSAPTGNVTITEL